jgi:hypothetical protein
MAKDGTRRPKVTWGQFLDCAPYFIEAMWSEDDAITPDYAPLVRASAYFSIFRGQVENGGIAQYLYNKSTTLPHFAEAPDLVRRHPELKEVADIMLMAHGDKDMVRHFEQAFEHQNEVIQHYVSTGEGGDEPITYEEKYRAFSTAYNERAWKINDRAMVRVQAHMLREPHAYLDIEAPPGVTGAGVEHAELESFGGIWEARFVDGFPIGPHFLTDEYGNRRIMRFSRTRMHLEFDRPAFREGDEPTREWFDFAAGVGGTRDFKGAHLGSVSNRRGFSDDHGLREYYEPNGSSRSAAVRLRGLSIEMHHPDREGSPFKICTPLPQGGAATRKYFANGQLNVEQEHSRDGPNFRITRCFDENGVDLAPGGTGVYRELWSMEEAGPRWRVGRLVNGLLDGEVRYINPDGSEWSKEQWTMGKVRTER